jgi:hypothetical protein
MGKDFPHRRLYGLFCGVLEGGRGVLGFLADVGSCGLEVCGGGFEAAGVFGEGLFQGGAVSGEGGPLGGQRAGGVLQGRELVLGGLHQAVDFQQLVVHRRIAPGGRLRKRKKSYAKPVAAAVAA